VWGGGVLGFAIDSQNNKWTRVAPLSLEWAALRRRSLGGRLVADEPLQHHHEAPRPLAERAVGVLLQEGEQLRPHLGQHGGHVVSGQRVAVVQIHHGILQVAARGQTKAPVTSLFTRSLEAIDRGMNSIGALSPLKE